MRSTDILNSAAGTTFPQSISIRREGLDDRKAVRNVIVDAFCQSEFGHNGEADIVDRLRRNNVESLSLVALDGEEIVGHVLFSSVLIQAVDVLAGGMGLGPLAVTPNLQRRGIGSALVQSGLNQLFETGCPFAVVLGHPEYYPRFGFEPAARYGVSHGFQGIPQELFFIRILAEGSVQSIPSGRAVYPREFGPQFDEGHES